MRFAVQTVHYIATIPFLFGITNILYKKAICMIQFPNVLFEYLK